jgi:putative heme degradation protein
MFKSLRHFYFFRCVTSNRLYISALRKMSAQEMLNSSTQSGLQITVYFHRKSCIQTHTIEFHVVQII